jgi:hypothetical protein
MTVFIFITLLTVVLVGVGIVFGWQHLQPVSKASHTITSTTSAPMPPGKTVSTRSCPRPTAFPRHTFWKGSRAPVWILVRSENSIDISKWLSPVSSSVPFVDYTPPKFEDAFSGYQRLALLTLFIRGEGKHPIYFVHRGNWHTLLPNMGSIAQTEKMDSALLYDYIKYQLLAYYGGFWITPETIVTADLHTLFDTTCRAARKSPVIPSDVPLAIMAGHMVVTSAYQTVEVPNDTCILCEPGNPVLLKIARALQTILARNPNYSAFAFDGFAGKMLLRYSMVSAYGSLARSIVRLNPRVNGTITTCNQCVPPSDYFALSPTCFPLSTTQWFVIDRERVRTTHRLKFFVSMTEEAILHSTMWITLLYQYALGLTDRIDQFAPCSEGARSTTIAVHAMHNPLRANWLQSWPQIFNT